MTTSYPKNKIRIVLFEKIHDAAADFLREEDFDVHQVPAALDASHLDAIADAHIVGIRSKSQMVADALDASTKLLAVGCFCIGTNQVELAHATKRGVPVFNSPFSNTRSVAELTIAEIVALHRRLFSRSAQMHTGHWVKSAQGAHEVRGRTLGIIGYGRIGSQVSILAEAMGMRVQFVDVQAVLALGNAQAAASIESLLESSDVVTVHVPSTPVTSGLIGDAQIKRMKRGAMLINNARGDVVDNTALADALKSGHLSGAAVDVHPAEPATNNDDTFDSPLCGLENVILTPHIGGSTQEAQESIATDVARKLTRFINIGSTVGAVNVPQVDLREQASAPGVRPHRILHLHRNVPGVLSTLHTIISETGANISAEHLQTQDDVGYVVLDFDPVDSPPMLEKLQDVPGTIRVRLLW